MASSFQTPPRNLPNGIPVARNLSSAAPSIMALQAQALQQNVDEVFIDQPTTARPQNGGVIMDILPGMSANMVAYRNDPLSLAEDFWQSGRRWAFFWVQRQENGVDHSNALIFDSQNRQYWWFEPFRSLDLPVPPGTIQNPNVPHCIQNMVSCLRRGCPGGGMPSTAILRMIRGGQRGGQLSCVRWVLRAYWELLQGNFPDQHTGDEWEAHIFRI